MTDNPLGVDGAPTPPPAPGDTTPRAQFSPDAPTAPPGQQLPKRIRGTRQRTALGVVGAVLLLLLKFKVILELFRHAHSGATVVFAIAVAALVIWGVVRRGRLF